MSQAKTFEDTLAQYMESILSQDIGRQSKELLTREINLLTDDLMKVQELLSMEHNRSRLKNAKSTYQSLIKRFTTLTNMSEVDSLVEATKKNASIIEQICSTIRDSITEKPSLNIM